MLDFLFLAVVLGFVFVCLVIIVEWVISGELDLTGIPPLAMCLAIAVLVLGTFTAIMLSGQDTLKLQGEDLLAKHRDDIHQVGGVNDTYEPYDVTCSSDSCIILQRSKRCRLLRQNVTVAQRMLGDEGKRLNDANRLLKRCCNYDVLGRHREVHGNFTVEWIDLGCNSTNRQVFLELVGGEVNVTG